MGDKRDTSKDGTRNNVETYALTHCKPLWDALQSRSRTKRKVNKTLINNAILKIPTRPYAFSTKAPYVSWDSLIDRSYSGLHLPSRDWEPLTDEKHLGLALRPTDGFEKSLPPLEDLESLYHMGDETKYSPKSNLIFPYFVQWFTDGFLRTNRQEPLKNVSNHHIDFCTVYGLHPEITTQLRSHERGRLKSQQINGEEYPPFYYDASGQPKPQFSAIPHLVGHELPVDKRGKLFAMGVEVERSNVQAGYVMLNVLCLREHNRLAALLASKYPRWDDERLFQTARNILIVEVMKIVIDDYINHITPYHFKFMTDPLSFTDEKWYRLNWITVEFSLVYRWHSMLPDTLMHAGRRISMESTMWNSDMVTAHGLGTLFEESCTQPAAKLSLFNTPKFMLPIEMASVSLGREAKLRGYNDYRELFGYPRVTSFNQISGDERVVSKLKSLYGHVDNLELFVGMFAEDLRTNSALPPLVGRLVGIDAFSQALTCPLLAENVFNKETFSPAGWEEIMSLHSLSDLLHRNVPAGKRYTVDFYRAGWKRV
jgi:prostaglandin-endoperoxide synthase 2